MFIGKTIGYYRLIRSPLLLTLLFRKFITLQRYLHGFHFNLILFSSFCLINNNKQLNINLFE